MSRDTFTSALMLWYQEHARVLPWKADKDPYKIWLSEVILQQTRVDQGMPYYLRFIDAFPDVNALAEASEDQVLKLWEGLGYYSRARNLHFTARSIVYNLNGQFPDTYQGLLKLKGVGPYTAAAIASFAYDLPRAVVDGNVIRVLTRYIGVDQPVDQTMVKKSLDSIAREYLDESNPGIYNQAIMDFGATQCVPANPKCNICPLNESCFAYAYNRVNEIPVKKKKVTKQKLDIDYHILFDESHILIKKRTKDDIWKGLHDFISTPGNQGVDEVIQEISGTLMNDSLVHIKSMGPIVHILTHRKINAQFHFHYFNFTGRQEAVMAPYYLVERKKLSNFAFPALIKKHIIDPGMLNDEKLFDKVQDKD